MSEKELEEALLEGEHELNDATAHAKKLGDAIETLARVVGRHYGGKASVKLRDAVDDVDPHSEWTKAMLTVWSVDQASPAKVLCTIDRRAGFVFPVRLRYADVDVYVSDETELGHAFADLLRHPLTIRAIRASAEAA